jgi:hypothetical protein
MPSGSDECFGGMANREKGDYEKREAGMEEWEREYGNRIAAPNSLS